MRHAPLGVWLFSRDGRFGLFSLVFGEIGLGGGDTRTKPDICSSACEAHFRHGQCRQAHRFIEVPQMSDAEHIAASWAKPLPKEVL